MGTAASWELETGGGWVQAGTALGEAYFRAEFGPTLLYVSCLQRGSTAESVLPHIHLATSHSDIS